MEVSMSRIAEYQRLRAVAKRLREDVTKALGKDNPSNDKHRATMRFVQVTQHQFSPLEFHFDMSCGYYGDSSCRSLTSKEIGAYLATAINERAIELLDRAVALADRDAEKARKAAEEEARSVLEEVKAG
jgi:hypothetical protein